MESRRQEHETQESEKDLIVSEWRQVLTPTYPFLHFNYHPLTTPFHHHILLASTINPPPSISIN
jgi:hypothetical protein